MSEPDEPGRVKRLEEELRRKTEQVHVLRQVSSRINATMNQEEIYDIALHTLRDVFGFSHALILLVDEAGRALEVAASRGYPTSARGARVEIGVGVIGTVAQRRKMMRVGNLREQRAYAAAVRRQIEASGQAGTPAPPPDLPGLDDAECQIGIPLMIEDRLVGVFFVESAEQRTFNTHEETLIAIVANLCASAIHNAQLYRREEQRRRSLEGTVAHRTRELERTNRELSAARELRAKQRRRFGFDDLVGTSRPIRETKKLLAKVVQSPATTVLVTGENGTGKDLVAKILHDQSARAAAPFMNITCSALTESLLESELFGHERGAFTDAHRLKRGLFELADGGSVFLDEIGEMGMPLQSKLLRFLEERTFMRVGGATDIRVDVRIIAATNRDLEQSVRDGQFRQDLYYRLRVLPIEMPPLRARTADIPELTMRFLRQFRREFNKDVREVAPQAMQQLAAYPWPGNVRELRNAVERAVLVAESPTLGVEDFPVLTATGVATAGPHLPPEGLRFEDLERGLVREALERAEWNTARAARLLGMPRDWLRYRIGKFGLRRPGT